MVEDPKIRKLAYQLFLEEVPGLLETIEQELFDLDNNAERPLKVNNLMRATHTIKGGAANVELDKIESIAHRLEDILKAFYNPDLIIDSTLKSLLFDIYEDLRLLLFAKIDSTNINEKEVIKLTESYLDRLEERLRDYIGDREAFPSSAELGLDPVKMFFETVVSERLEKISAIIDNPESDRIIETVREQAIVFRGVGRSLNLNNFVALAETILTSLDNSPQEPNQIAKKALHDFQKIQKSILQEREVLNKKSSLDLVESVNDLEKQNVSLTELLAQLEQFIDSSDREFYLNIIKCILGWFHRYENIDISELNLDLIVPIELLKNSQKLAEHVDLWLDRFTRYIELMGSTSHVNLYRKLTVLKAIVAVIKFQYFQAFKKVATPEQLPVIENFGERINELELEHQKNQLNLTEKNWLDRSYIQDLIQVIDRR